MPPAGRRCLRPRPGACTTISCHTCPGRARSEWRTLEGDQVAKLDRAKVCTVYGPGQVIFYQGNPCLGLHCVTEGTVALRKVDAEGNAVIVRLVHPGETLGCRTFFGGGRYAATAEALTQATVCFVDRASVMDLLAGSRGLALGFLRRMAQDLRAADEDKLETVSLSVRERVARLLLLLADRYGREEPGRGFTLELPLARQDMAALLGVRAESVARAVRALEDEGLAHFEGRAVTIPCIERLMGEDPWDA